MLLPSFRRSPEPASARPHRRRIAVILLTVAAFAATLGLVAPSSADAAADWQTEMLTLVNNYRAANGLGPLKLCNNLTGSAQNHASDMAVRNYFSHTSPEGTTFVQRAEAAGYTGWYSLSENIASGFSSVTAVMTGWINSPGHRANLLGAESKDIGFGLAYNGSGVPYWAQEFGAGGKCGSSVVGGFDGVTSSWPQTARVRGWAFDDRSAGTVLNIDVYVDGRMLGRHPASQYRADVGRAFPNAGPYHGFDVTFNASAGFHEVCVYVNSLTPGVYPVLGCQTIALASADPVGNIDQAGSPAPGLIHLAGWTFDPETPASLDVHLYVDGRMAGAIPANVYRGDIAVAFPAYGGFHGFDATVPVDFGGFHQICAYGINKFLGDNRLIGCRNVLVNNPSPIGNLDGVDRTGPGTVAARGWALDPDTALPISVDIYVDGTKAGRYAANGYRSDIAFFFAAFGGNHGYTVPLTLAPGSHTVCAYGINVGTVGTNTTLGCYAVTMPKDPFGSFDGVAAAKGTVTGSGWAIDPETAGSIGVHVYMDGVFKAAVTASGTRTDVGNAFPGFGSNHGYSFNIAAAPGPHTVCTYAINVGAGSNRFIMCRGVWA